MRCYKVFNCLMCIIATSCEAATRPGPNHLVSDEAAVPYSGLMQRLFDDEFGGIALGTPWNHSNAEESLFLSRRALSAGAVLLCSVGTVTEGSIDDSTATSVEFRGPGYFLSGVASAPCPKISIASNSYSYSILRQSGASLVGQSVVMFLRHFNENGQTTWHWHVEPDRPDIRGLIQQLRGPLN